MRAWASSWAKLPASEKEEYGNKAKQVREGTVEIATEKDKKRLAKKLIIQLRAIVSKPSDFALTPRFLHQSQPSTGSSRLSRNMAENVTKIQLLTCYPYMRLFRGIWYIWYFECL